jgi:hypothetical protein
MRVHATRLARRGTLLFQTIIGIAACGDGGSGPVVPATVVLDPASASFTAVGQTRQLSATVTDQNGNPIASPSLSWSSSDTAVATVSASGLVMASGGGAAEITATADAASASAAVSVVQTPAQLEKVSGDGQTGAPGQSLPLPLTVQVDDASGAPVAGATVAFAAEPASGTILTASATTGPDGRAATGFTPLALGAQQITATVANTALAASFTVTGASPFAVELRFLTTPTQTQREAFLAAQQRWQSLVVSELEDVRLDAGAGTCGEESPAIQRTVDDVLILITLEPIDGPGGVLGAAGPCYARDPEFQTVLGLMRFDTADLDVLESAGLLQVVILHEMAHVLGYGTLWPNRGLLADASLSGGTDPHFIGAEATLEFNAAGGATYAGGLKVPVENTGGAGTADSHWRESVFGSELMTGFVNPGTNPLSRVSVAALADEGYDVNLAGADSYTLVPSLLAFDRGPAFELQDDVLPLPLHVVGSGGHLMRVLSR